MEIVAASALLFGGLALVAVARHRAGRADARRRAPRPSWNCQNVPLCRDAESPPTKSHLTSGRVRTPLRRHTHAYC